MSVILTKDATVVTLTQAQAYPFAPIEHVVMQPEAETDGGTRYIYDKGSFTRFTIRAPATPRSEYTALLSFFETDVTWKAASFTLTDERSVNHTVRLEQDRFGPPEQAFEFYDVEFDVREE